MADEEWHPTQNVAPGADPEQPGPGPRPALSSELEMVVCSPSRIHAAPRPGDHPQVGFAADAGQFGGAVHRHPAHQFRGHVVLGFAARLPDALVGVLPHADRAVGLCLDQGPQPAG